MQQSSRAHTVRCSTYGREVAHVIQAFHDGQHPEGARSSHLQAARVLSLVLDVVGKTAVDTRLPAEGCMQLASWDDRRALHSHRQQDQKAGLHTMGPGTCLLHARHPVLADEALKLLDYLLRRRCAPFLQLEAVVEGKPASHRDAGWALAASRSSACASLLEGSVHPATTSHRRECSWP